MSLNKPDCIYGKSCYRRNPTHFEEYRHPDEVLQRVKALQNSGDSSEPCSSSNKRIKLNDNTDNSKSVQHSNVLNNNTRGFFLTKVHGIDSKFNSTNPPTISIREILNEKNGDLVESIQFSFMFELDWLIDQYPNTWKKCPLFIVFGEKQKSDSVEMTNQSKNFSQIILCPVKINDPFGTHHTKMMILRYKTGIQVVIHTANLVNSDWYQKTQGVWVSPIFPLMSDSSLGSDSETNFKEDLLKYLQNYKSNHINKWCDIIKKHDFTLADVFLIGSVPGRHKDVDRVSYGHLKLRKILSGKFGPNADTASWPTICQFSSIGSLGPSSNKWLTGQFQSSLAQTMNDVSLLKPALKCIFPTVENVRSSLEGYMAGASLPYSHKTASRQPYLTEYLYQWKASSSGRSAASPHIKTYCKLSPDSKEIAWFCLTSANLSKAAWGELQCNGSQLAIRSFELGVLFLPKIMNKTNTFKVKPDSPSNGTSPIFQLPFDTPLVSYNSSDKPWMWDLCYLERPDSLGNMWTPN